MKLLNQFSVGKITTALTVGAAILLSSCGEKEVKTPVKPVPEVSAAKPASVVKPVIPTPADKVTENLETINGGKVYKKCQACHGKTGEGIPGAYPPLTERLAALLANDAGREYLALVVINGVRGEMNINDTRYVGTMPRQGGMTHGKTAAVLNYIMTEFNGVAAGDADLFTIDEIAKIKSDNGRITGQNVYKKRAEAFSEIQK